MTREELLQRHCRPQEGKPAFDRAESGRWLAAHRDRLAAMGAVGMLVEARTMEDLRAIAALADGLPILPASGTDIAKALGLTHYPVLITRDHLAQ